MTIDDHIAELAQTAVRDAIRDTLAELSDRPLVVSADEAAHLLGVSRRSVANWTAAGLLPRVPHTSRLVIPRAAVEAFANGEPDPA